MLHFGSKIVSSLLDLRSRSEIYLFAGPCEADHKKDYARVCACFNKHFEPKRVTKLYMKKFDALVQKPGESIGEYISNLREVAHYCDW